MKMPIDRFFNLVYFWSTEGADQDAIDKFDMKLNMPTIGMKGQPVLTGPWAPEAEAAALGGLAAALGGGGR